MTGLRFQGRNGIQRFPQRARAAFRAIARRSSAVSFLARALPPSRPSRRRASSTSGGNRRRAMIV
jgi:hypothetical protein